MTLHKHRTKPIDITTTLIGRHIFFRPIQQPTKAIIVDLTPNTDYKIIGINTTWSEHRTDGMYDMVYIRDDKGARLSITLNTPSVHLDKAGLFYLRPAPTPAPAEQLALSIVSEVSS